MSETIVKRYDHATGAGPDHFERTFGTEEEAQDYCDRENTPDSAYLFKIEGADRDEGATISGLSDDELIREMKRRGLG